MKVCCDRSELAERLQAVAGIVPSASTSKPILRNFLLRGRAPELEVEVTDLDIAARIRVERVEVLEDGAAAVPAQRFVSLLRELPVGRVTIAAPLEAGQEDEGAGTRHGCLLSAESYEFHLLGDDPDEFPEISLFSAEDALHVPREPFVEALRRVAIAAGRDMSRYQLMGVFFEVEGDELQLTATDSKRLAHDLVKVKNPEGLAAQGIVPNRAVDVISKVLADGGEEFRLALLPTEVQVDFGYGQLLAKLIEGMFPDYREVMPKDFKTKSVLRRNELSSALRMASLVTDRETAGVVFHFRDEELTLESRAKDVGDSRIRVPAKVEGEELTIQFNPAFLMDSLRVLAEESIEFQFSGPSKPGTIRGESHYRYLVSPLVRRRDEGT